MTHKQYTDQYCTNQRTAAYRIKQVCGVGYDADSELTTEQQTALFERFPPNGERPQKAHTVKQYKLAPVAVNVQDVFGEVENVSFALAQTEKRKQQTAIHETIEQPQTAKRFSPQTEKNIMFFAPLFVNLVSIALTIAGLFLFASFFGVALGAMFGITLICAVIVSRNSNKGDTSQAALNVVLYMELGACLLHPFTFHQALPECHIWLRIGAALVMSAFVGLLSYNAVLMVRNYNAE